MHSIHDAYWIYHTGGQHNLSSTYIASDVGIHRFGTLEARSRTFYYRHVCSIQLFVHASLLMVACRRHVLSLAGKWKHKVSVISSLSSLRPDLVSTSIYTMWLWTPTAPNAHGVNRTLVNWDAKPCIMCIGLFGTLLDAAKIFGTGLSKGNYTSN